MDVKYAKDVSSSNSDHLIQPEPDSQETQSFLVELQKCVMLEITTGERRAGTSKEITAWALKKYQQNPVLGDISQATMNIKEDLVTSSSDLPTSKASIEQLYALEHHPIPKFFFVSTDYEGEPVGFLFQREPLKGGGRIYSATGFDSKNYFKRVSRIEFRISSASPEPFVSQLSNNGWFHASKDEFSKNSYLDLAFRCLAIYCNYKYPRLNNDSVIIAKSEKPKDNDHLIELIVRAHKRKERCTRIRLPINKIQPRDIDYALNIPEADIQDFMRRVADWGAPIAQFLLYEEDGQLIMDDDYILYCAYKALEVDSVKAVIVGDFDESGIEILARGYGELIPPIITDRGKEKTDKKLSKEEILHEKLSALIPKGSSKSELKQKFMNFCRLLGRDSTREKDLQNFIRDNPEIFDCHFGRMHMEVPIGNFRADMILEYEQSHRRTLLVELERHTDQIFTKNNRLRNKVTHAIQQVEDWIGEIRANKDNIPDWLKKEYIAEGAVVIGRTKHLTNKQKETLRTINTNRTVKIMTYDDLLEQMLRLINTL